MRTSNKHRLDESFLHNNCQMILIFKEETLLYIINWFALSSTAQFAKTTGKPQMAFLLGKSTFLQTFNRPVNAFPLCSLFSYLLSSFQLCLSSAQSWQDGSGNWPFWCQLIISILCICSWITAVFGRADLAVPLHFFETTKGGYEHWKCMEQKYRKISIIFLLGQRNLNSIVHFNFILY